MTNFLKYFCIYLGCMGLLSSCGDSDLTKFDNIVGVKNWTPTMALQLAHGEYKVWDLVNQADTTVLAKEGNKIFIRHLEENIYSLNVKDVIELPKNIANIDIQIPVVPSAVALGEDVPFSKQGEASIQFTEGRLKKVNGSLTCRYTLPQTSFKYNATMIFENLLDSQGEPCKLDITGGLGTFEWDSILLNMEEVPNQIQYKIEGKLPSGEIIDESELVFKFSFEDFDFTSVEGEINRQEIPIDLGQFEMDVEFWDKFKGDLKFADPRVDLIVTNYGLGVPVQLDMSFVAYGEGRQLALRTENGYMPFFEGWKGGEEEKEIQGYDKENSNIDTLLSLPPKDRITYSGTVIVSPEAGDTAVLLKEGTAKIDVKVEIPLHLSAKNILFQDTIDGIDISDADKIEAASLKVKAKNQIPLGLGKGYLYLLNQNYDCIDTIRVEQLVEAPEVNSQGEVLLPVVEKDAPVIELSEKNIQNLNDTKYIVISVEASTSNGGDVATHINADASLEMKIILEVKADLTDL